MNFNNCDGCFITPPQFFKLKKDELFNFLFRHKCLLKIKKCEQCNQQCIMTKRKSTGKNSEDLEIFRCQKVRYVERNKRKQKIKCNFMESIRKNTFFEGSHLSIETICQIAVYNLMSLQSKFETIQNDLKIAPTTVNDWCNFVREVYIDWAINLNNNKIGGFGKIVEIDKTKCGKRKYNKGRILERQWIFGGIERDTKHFFLVPVEDRTEDTLIKIIKENINDGTTIMSDCWRSYEGLNNEGFTHLTVNHSINFVDPDTKAHTQNIERLWRDLKDDLPKYGRSKEHFLGYLAEFLFKKKFSNNADRIHEFFMAMGKLYNPEEENVDCHKEHARDGPSSSEV